jgi:hypothetical protein
MAEALRDQVDALTGFSTTEDLALKDWFEAGIKEVINYMPPKLLKLCAAMQTFTSVAAGSEAETLNTGKILSVLSSNTRCREIASDLKGRASDSDDILYATSTDPVFYVEANLINALPSGLSCKYEEVQYPTVTVASDTAIAVFPDEAEYLVVLYAAIKALQVLMNDKAGNASITTALALMAASIVNAEDEIEDAAKMVANIVLGVAEVTESAVDTDTSSSEMLTAANAITTALGQINTYNFDDEDTFTTTSSQLTRVKAALDDAEDVINSDEPSATTDAFGAQSNEDIELVTSALNIAQSEIQRANMHITEWNTILQGAVTQAQGFVGEVQARGAWTSAKAQVWNGYFASAQAYAQAAQTYLSAAQGYGNEIQVRLGVIQAEYSWLEKQQMKLQSDYDRGLMALSGRQFERPRAGA